MLNPCALTSIMFMYATSKMPKPPTAPIDVAMQRLRDRLWAKYSVAINNPADPDFVIERDSFDQAIREAVQEGIGIGRESVALAGKTQVTAEHLDPIPLSERRPADEDRESDGDQSFWAGKLLGRKWLWIREWDSTAAIAESYTHWLPASVRYLPAKVEL